MPPGAFTFFVAGSVPVRNPKGRKMPNPDLRVKDANPNDPRNVHTMRATNAALFPSTRAHYILIAVFVAVLTVAAIISY